MSLLGGGDHQLDTIELVRLGGTRIVIDGDDVGFRMQATDLAEHAAAGHMVGQAGERLRADHVRATLFDEFQNLGRQQPAFTGLHADGGDFGGLLDQFGHRLVLLELAVRCGQRGLDRRVVQVEALAHQGVNRLVAAQVLLVPVGDVGAGGHEFHDAGHHGLAILGFDDVDHVVVRVRLVLDKNLADHADTHLARDVAQRQIVEGLHDLLGQHVIRQIALLDARRLGCGLGIAVMLDGLTHDGVPQLVQLVGRTFLHLIRAYAVEALHEQVAQNQRLDGTVQQGQGGLEAGVVFEALGGDGDDRNLRVAGIDQSLADQAEVVGRTAHTTGLGDGERHLVRIVLAFLNRADELADDHDCRVTGVVVHVFEAGFHVAAARVLQDVELVAAGADDRLDQGHVDRAHLRADNRIVLLHVLDELLTMRVSGHGGVVVAGLLGVLGVRHTSSAVRSAVLAGDCGLQVAFGGALGGGAHGLGELRVGGHGAVKQNLAAGGWRGGAGLAESGGLGALHGLRRGGFAGLVGFALLDGGLERAQSNLGSAQVGDLVNLQQRVHVRLVGQDLGHLIGGDGVETAAEGVELHEFEARIGGHEMRGRVQTGVVGPLVGDAQRHLGDCAVAYVAESGGVLGARVGFAFREEFGEVELLPRLQFADRILGEDDHAERADGFGDAVVDFRVDVVGASGKHDAAAVVLLHVGEGFEAFLLDVVFEDLVFGVGGLDSSFGLFAADARPCELLDDTVDHELVVGEVEVRVHVAHVGVTQFGHVRADDERIVGDDRAVVVVVRVGHEVVLVTDARVEDRLHALVEKPFDVAVHELGRVADVLGGDRFDAGFEQFVAGTAGDHHLETERGEQREPERVVLVHVERARDANLASGGVLVGEAAVGEAALVLVVVQVRTVGAFLLGIAAAFATVAGHEAGAVGERGDGELAVVLAQLAHVAFGGHRHFVEGFAGED